jgi:hypothetical protein
MKGLIALFALSMILLPSHANAQQDGFGSIEGNVFDATTLKPLPNVSVLLQIKLDQQSDTTALSTTDSNGLFIDEIGAISNGQSATLTAFCKTKKGTVTSATFFYPVVRPTIYYRNFYLTLPRNIHACTR